MNVLVWGKENSYFWKIHSLGMCFGQDPVSINVLKAKILMDSCEEQDWVLLLHPWRITLPCMCPQGRRLDWTRVGETGLVRAVSMGWYSAEMHNRLDLLRALKGIGVTSLSPYFPFSKSLKPIEVHGQYGQPGQHSKVMSQVLTNRDAGWKIMRLKYVPTSLLLLPGLWACNYVQMSSPSFPGQALRLESVYQ